MPGPNRTDYEAWNVTPGIVRVSCVFWPNGASDPIVDSRIGVASVSRTSYGQWLITLQNKYVSLESFSVDLLYATADAYKVISMGEDVASAKIFKVGLLDVFGVTSDIVYNVGKKISVTLFLKATTAV